MIVWKRAALLGVFSWLIPFLLSFFVFPLKRVNAPLFANIMTLIVVVTAGVLLRWYFADRAVSTREALLVGALWLVMNLVFDYPMFGYGPMKMSVGHYYSEIGTAYLVFPAFAVGAARLMGAPKRSAA